MNTQIIAILSIVFIVVGIGCFYVCAYTAGYNACDRANEQYYKKFRNDHRELIRAHYEVWCENYELKQEIKLLKKGKNNGKENQRSNQQ